MIAFSTSFLALLGFSILPISASEKLLPRQNAVCHQTPRSDFISNELWEDNFIDFEGKLLPLMKDMMCKEKCALMKTNTCALNVVVEDDARITFKITRNDALGNLWSCENDIWDGLIDCLRGNSPLSGGQINSDGDIFEVSFEKYEQPTFIEQQPRGGDPSQPTPGNGDQFPPDINQDPTFYISLTYLVDGASGLKGEVAIYGRNANYDIMAPKRQEYTTKLEGYIGPDMVPNPNFWYDSYSAFDQFTLKGDPSGRICGLQENFMFVKTRPGRFAFTDRGEEGEFIGYCDLLPKPKSPQEPIQPGEQAPPTGTVGYSDDGLNNRIYVVYYPIFACFSNGNPNYCPDYGSS